jgi:sugar/nucleoside kinase (ribokinase family)
LVFGDAMIDVTVELHEQLRIGSDTRGVVTSQGGGSAGNTAAWLAKVGCDVTFLGRVGEDGGAHEFRESLLAMGVKPSLVVDPTRATGVCVCLIDDSGERSMIPSAGANVGWSIREVEQVNLSDFDHLHVSAYPMLREETTAPARALIEAARAGGLSVSVDPASYGPLEDFGAEAFLNAVGQVNVLLPDTREMQVLANTQDVRAGIEFLLKFARVVVVKQGAKGATAGVRGGAVIEAPGEERRVARDTTGAGDAFAAGFLNAWLNSFELSQCLRAGNQLAADAVQLIGGRPATR